MTKHKIVHHPKFGAVVAIMSTGDEQTPLYMIMSNKDNVPHADKVLVFENDDLAQAAIDELAKYIMPEDEIDKMEVIYLDKQLETYKGFDSVHGAMSGSGLADVMEVIGALPSIDLHGDYKFVMNHYRPISYKLH